MEQSAELLMFSGGDERDGVVPYVRTASFAKINEHRAAVVQAPDNPDSKLPAWRWVLYAVIIIVFPIVWRPWWMAVITIGLFCLVMLLVVPPRKMRR
jgi:hypothetical protein